MTHLNERTTVPLFAILGALVTAIGAYGGTMLFVSSVATKAEVAEAKNIQQDRRLDELITTLRDLTNGVSDIKAAGARSEGKIEILLQRVSK